MVFLMDSLCIHTCSVLNNRPTYHLVEKLKQYERVEEVIMLIQ